MSLNDYNLLSRTNVQWICNRCNSSNIDSFTFHSYELSNSYAPLSQLSDDCPSGDSLKSPPSQANNSRPLFTSTPKNSHSTQKKTHSNRTNSPSLVSTSPESNQSSDPYDNIGPKTQNLRFLNVNCQSVRGKKASLAAALEYLKPDVICGTESWLWGLKPGKPPSSDSILSSEIFPPSYKIYRNDRDKSGGGVFIGIHESITAIERVDFEGQADEINWCTLKIKNQKHLHVGVFYMPHRNPNDVEKLSKSLEKIKSDNIMLLGDFNCPNINWETHTTSNCTGKDNQTQQALIDLAQEHGLCQIHQTPTRGPNLLDLVFTTNKSLIKSSENVPGIADHDMIVTDTNIKAIPTKKCPRKCYIYSKADWTKLEAMNNELSESICKMEKEGCSIEDLWTTFRDQLLKNADTCIPHKTSSSKRSLPWINREIRSMLKKKCRLYKKAKKSNNWTKFRSFQKACRKKMKQAEYDHINGAIVEGFNNNNSKPFWNYVKAKKQDCIGVAPLKQKGELISDNKGKANALIDQFESVFTKDQSPTMTPVYCKPTTGMNDIKVERLGVQKLLERINPNKAVGPDGIPNPILKNCAVSLAKGIQCLYQRSLDSGCLPTDWLNANVTPVFKKGDRHQPENYRPVSLTSVTGKLLEHIVCRSLMDHLESNKILTSLNHGFRSGYSCDTQLVVTLDDLTKAYDQGYQTDVAILDFSKAFDTVPHEKLLHKLYQYGVHGELHTWFRTFLTCRNMQVVVDGEASRPVYVASGVPQGTVLGPILFLCHINDLPDCVDSQVRLFADDCLIYRQIRTQDDHAIFQNDLKNLEEWASNWGMRFNAKKCYIMSVRQKSQHFYELGGHILKQVSQNPYLGVLLSDDLKWAPHINNISSKAASTLGFLRRNLKSCPQECRKLAYISMVRSTLEYACSTWDPYLQKDINKLEGLQRKAIRFISNNYTSREEGFITRKMEDLDLMTLKERRKAVRLTLLYKTINGQLPSIHPDQYIKPAANTRRRCGPRKFDEFTTEKSFRNWHRTNSKSYTILLGRTDQYKNSFFPRTVIDWNNLSEETTAAQTVGTFTSLLRKNESLNIAHKPPGVNNVKI